MILGERSLPAPGTQTCTNTVPDFEFDLLLCQPNYAAPCLYRVKSRTLAVILVSDFVFFLDLPLTLCLDTGVGGRLSQPTAIFLQHVGAVRGKGSQILICHNHSKQPGQQQNKETCAKDETPQGSQGWSQLNKRNHTAVSIMFFFFFLLI